MTVYYNEHDPFPVAWLENLIAAGHIAKGKVDARDIRTVEPADLSGYTQAHFFAGIGVWSYALRLAGWPDDARVWTGSCPCQPFSGAGKRRGKSDERHLWPEWFRLIRECRPPILFGEQVASPDGLDWLDTVFSDLETEDYACGAADLCAAGVGAPHIRQRLFFVAVADRERRKGERLRIQSGRPPKAGAEVGRGGEAGELADSNGRRQQERWAKSRSANWNARHEMDGSAAPQFREAGDLGDASSAGPQGRSERRNGASQRASRPSGVASFWSAADWIPCLDGVARPVEPGTFPLAHRSPARVGRLRAYGNAIVPQVAAVFIRAAMESGVM